MLGISILRLSCGVLAGVLISFGIGATVVAVGLYDSESRARELPLVSSASPEVNRLPENRPTVGQQAIDTAMNVFSIKVPRKIKGPFYDPNLEDRGLTVRHGLGSDPVVYIGKDAFGSWALLGSTLAHEIEIHCRQNFLAIHLENLAGFDGTGSAEREAYQYELHNAKRFGLAQFDQDMIKSASTFFYPVRSHNMAIKFTPVKKWVEKIGSGSLSSRSF